MCNAFIECRPRINDHGRQPEPNVDARNPTDLHVNWFGILVPKLNLSHIDPGYFTLIQVSSPLTQVIST